MTRTILDADNCVLYVPVHLHPYDTLVISGRWNETRFTHTTIGLLFPRERQGGNSRDRGEGDKEGVAGGGKKRRETDQIEWRTVL